MRADTGLEIRSVASLFARESRDLCRWNGKFAQNSIPLDVIIKP
jgi:hypothetical protein